MSPRRAVGIVVVALFIGSVSVARENYVLGLALFVSSAALGMMEWPKPED